MPQRKPTTTWVVTLDGARARTYARVSPEERLIPVPEGSFDGTRALSQAINSDRPGDAQESVGGARHAIEPRTDAHRHAEAEFVRHVGDKLKHYADTGAYDELIVVAAPKALGDVRASWDSRFRKRFVKLEIHGDWTMMGAGEVADHLQSHLRRSHSGESA